MDTDEGGLSMRRNRDYITKQKRGHTKGKSVNMNKPNKKTESNESYDSFIYRCSFLTIFNSMKRVMIMTMIRMIEKHKILQRIYLIDIDRYLSM